MSRHAQGGGAPRELGRQRRRRRQVVAGRGRQEAIQDLNQSGEAYEQQLKRKPKTIVLPGKAPPKDHKAPGGGSGAQTIG